MFPCVCVHACMQMCTPEEARVGFPGVGVSGIYELQLLHMVGVNQTYVGVRN